MDTRSVMLVYDDGFRGYDFGPQHPLRPERLQLGLDLMREASLLNDGDIFRPTPASDSEIETVHDPSYVAAVRAASQGVLTAPELARFGLGPGDTPAFPGMHTAAALVAGGTVGAVRAIMEGRINHAFNPGGGWHHALRARASGFCVYNDPAMAAAIAAREYGARVLYADFDCHHGDGVQWIFYDQPSVLTVSFHESGQFLFPGSGGIRELGIGEGLGYSVNLPLAPFTQDQSWLEAIRDVLPLIAERFRPDLLITAHGADTHDWDPLTHMALGTQSFAAQAEIAHSLAHGNCGGRWLAVGSGGYEWRRVVPRSWAILWAEMAGRPLPDAIPMHWIERYDDPEGEPLPRMFHDDPSLFRPLPQHERAAADNRGTVKRALRLLDEARQAVH